MSSPISHVLDDAGDLWREFGVISQPTMIFFAADGTHEVHSGALGPQALLDKVTALAET